MERKIRKMEETRALLDRAVQETARREGGAPPVGGIAGVSGKLVGIEFIRNVLYNISKPFISRMGFVRRRVLAGGALG